MKKTFLLLLVASLSLVASAQTFDEWFRQKKTQKTYLLQQIAALQVLNGFIKSGYRNAKTGTNSISQSKAGDYRLHNGFFRSLERVSSSVSGNKRIAAIVSYGTRILSQSKEAIHNVQISKRLTSEETLHCTRVYQFLLSECLKVVDELFAIMSDGERRMSQDERIKRIDELYVEVQRQYSFCCSFGDAKAMLTHQRAMEQKAISLSKSINGLQ